jgi:hypothetical protein
VRKDFLVLMCGEVFMERLWKNEAWNGVVRSKLSWWNLWTFGLINCFSQIHCWICVKIRSILIWKV